MAKLIDEVKAGASGLWPWPDPFSTKDVSTPRDGAPSWFTYDDTHPSTAVRVREMGREFWAAQRPYRNQDGVVVSAQPHEVERMRQERVIKRGCDQAVRESGRWAAGELVAALLVGLYAYSSGSLFAVCLYLTLVIGSSLSVWRWTVTGLLVRRLTLDIQRVHATYHQMEPERWPFSPERLESERESAAAAA